MILYLDTSSLIKLFLEEAHSDLVHGWVEEAEVVCTSRVAYPEAMAALGRRRREGDLDEEAFHAVVHAFQEQWPDFSIVDLNEESAGKLAIEHGLRGFDAIHLAAAVDVGSGADPLPVRFSSFDRLLNRAAEAAGFVVLDTEEPVQPEAS
ncbi:MAG: type II toxin-antitoxin system VapC family toxin [bacterium]|nr:type II toxin-antitoxin system VapC family toxin [bacterium]